MRRYYISCIGGLSRTYYYNLSREKSIDNSAGCRDPGEARNWDLRRFTIYVTPLDRGIDPTLLITGEQRDKVCYEVFVMVFIDTINH